MGRFVRLPFEFNKAETPLSFEFTKDRDAFTNLFSDWDAFLESLFEFTDDWDAFLESSFEFISDRN